MRKNKLKKQPLSEALKQQAALHKKYLEYSKLTLDELEELFPRLGGNYRQVCLEVAKEKTRALLANKPNEELEGDVK